MQKSGKSTKRLDRLAPNLVNICRFIWEWTYAKTISPSLPKGNFGGLGGQKCKSLENLPNGWTDWHQMQHAPTLFLIVVQYHPHILHCSAANRMHVYIVDSLVGSNGSGMTADVLYGQCSLLHFAHKPAPAWTRKDHLQT